MHIVTSASVKKNLNDFPTGHTVITTQSKHENLKSRNAPARLAENLTCLERVICLNSNHQILPHFRLVERLDATTVGPKRTTTPRRVAPVETKIATTP